MKSSQVSNRCVLASRRASAAARRSDWILSSSAATAASIPASGAVLLRRSCRATSIACPAARSRGPISIRTGTPFCSHSAYFQPGRILSRSSTGTKPTAGFSADASRCPASTTADRSSSFFQIGTTTTRRGASNGGSTSPWSSLWVITSAPMVRVDMPQLVAQTKSRRPSASWKVTSKARAKFCPRSWLVAACSARRSCIMASTEKVSTAPAKRSRGVLAPASTGMAMISSANQR